MLGDVSLTAGGTYDPSASTVTTAKIDAWEYGTIYVSSTSGFTTGFIVVHPYTSNQAYEVIAYSGKTSTTFTGLTRYEPIAAKRVHSSGSTVSEWMDVTEYLVDTMTLDMHQDDEVSDWKVQIKGHSYSSSLFLPDRAFLCMWRFRPNSGSMSSWTNWLVAYIGFLQDINVDGDWQEGNMWSASVVSLGYYVDRTDIESGITYGKIDLAEGKTVEVSSYLEDAYQEADSGEFTGDPDLDGPMAVDADLSTLWISDGEPSPTVETPIASAGNINEVYLRSETFMPDGLQWIELFWKSGQGMAPAGFGGCALCTSTTTWKWANWDPDGRVPLDNYLDLPQTPCIEIGDTWFGIFTNDKAAFMSYFPQCDADVYDWRAFEVGTFTLDPTGDLLALRWWGVNTWDIVWWDGGRASWALYDFTGGGSHYYALGGTNYSGWTGSMITTPPVGHSFRSNPTGNKGGTTAFYKQNEDHPTPGYYITGEPEYIIIDLGTLGISLSAALAQGYTVKAELTGTLGLTEGVGYVSIDTGGTAEVVRYTTIDRINNEILGLTRGQEGTSDIAHSAGAQVDQYEGGAATDRHLIQTLRWKRRPVLISGVYDVPYHFDVYSTIYDSGFPKPDEDAWDDGLGSGGWEDYFDRLASVRYYKSTSWQKTLTTPLRAKKVMIATKKMRAGGRVKFNSINIFGPSSYVYTAGAETGYVDTGWSSGIISHLLQTWLTIDKANIDTIAYGRQVYKLDVTRDRVSRAIRDLCGSAGTVVRYKLDNTIDLDWNTLLGMGGWPEVHFYWTRTNARSIKFGRKTQTNVAQVIVRLTNPEEEEFFEAAYPGTAFTIGEIVEHTDTLLVGDGDDAATIAEMIFHSRRLADTVDLVPVGIAEWILPGQRHVVTFDVDLDDTYVQSANVVVIGVTHNIRFGDAYGNGKQWTTDLTTRRVEYA